VLCFAVGTDPGVSFCFLRVPNVVWLYPVGPLTEVPAVVLVFFWMPQTDDPGFPPCAFPSTPGPFGVSSTAPLVGTRADVFFHPRLSISLSVSFVGSLDAPLPSFAFLPCAPLAVLVLLPTRHWTPFRELLLSVLNFV